MEQMQLGRLDGRLAAISMIKGITRERLKVGEVLLVSCISESMEGCNDCSSRMV